jgi:hypothetical protein
LHAVHASKAMQREAAIRQSLIRPRDRRTFAQGRYIVAWKQSLRSHWETLYACDFFAVETLGVFGTVRRTPDF